MTQAILPTRLWGMRDDRETREQFTVPMHDDAGNSFDDLFSMHNTRLGDGSTRRDARSDRDRVHPMSCLPRRSPTTVLL